MTPRRVVLPGILSLLALANGACGWGTVRTVDYSVRPIALVPFGSTVTDRSKPFAETFCAALPHTDDGRWGACAPYLETQVPPPAPVSSEIQTPLKVMLVGGAFSECFENKNLFVYDHSLEHLRKHGVVFGERLHVGGTNTPEENAKTIAKYLDTYPGDYIAIGHSKGAVDLMAAIQGHDNARRQIKALVSVAGAIGGSRLADLGVKLGIQGFQTAVRDSGLGRCEIVDHGGIDSLSRKVRYEALRQWHPPPSLRTYSLVAVSSKQKTSKPLQTMWQRNAYYSIDQDSHIIAEEAIIPGSELLGIVNADHWAVALPMSEHPLTRDKVDRNPFPRTALLEAIVRYVSAAAQAR
jgi:hypothetical protein